MPVDPGFGERLAGRVSSLYALAELALLKRIAQALARGIDAPDWAQRKLAELTQIRTAMAAELGLLDVSAGLMVREVVADAWTAGAESADEDMRRARIAPARMPPSRARAVQAIAEDTLRKTAQVRPVALRAVTDVYQTAVAEASSNVILGAQTRRDAAQTALNRLAGDGIRGFQDSAGRQWSMETYTEMAVRTGTGRAAVEGHVQELAANGLDLVIVSDAPRECPLCRPWEGKILSTSSGYQPSALIEVDDVTGDGKVKVRVSGTLEQARRAGFQHPNCRHSLGAYLPGLSTPRKPVSDPQGYRDQQRQREIERAIRHWKTREALALDESAAATARGKVSEWQAAMRAHLSAHPELKRQNAREQIGKAR